VSLFVGGGGVRGGGGNLFPALEIRYTLRAMNSLKAEFI
jgi:hypothetical protein